MAAKDAVDHLLLGVSDLDRGIDFVQRLTGVKAAFGGTHPGAGTRNALLSLGGKHYLEIIAPDPAQSAYNFHIDVRSLTEPRLINWAAAANVGETLKLATAAGHQVFGPRDGSRARPDGKMLRWKTLGVISKLGGNGVAPVPFFIEWEPGSVHPSSDSPTGCVLRSFEIEYPDPPPLASTLRGLGIDARITKSDNVRLIATLDSPKGVVRLT